MGRMQFVEKQNHHLERTMVAAAVDVLKPKVVVLDLLIEVE